MDVVGPEVENVASDGFDGAEIGMPGGAVANPLAFDGVLLVSEHKYYVGSITDVIQRTRRSILVGPVWSQEIDILGGERGAETFVAGRGLGVFTWSTEEEVGGDSKVE